MARDKAYPPWSDAEKIQLLLEIANQVNQDPNWRAINIPVGRTKAQAQQLFTTMKSHAPTAPPTVADTPAAAAPINTTTLPISSPSSTKKRPRSEDDPATGTTDAPSSSGTTQETPVTKRKRGRPTKAETEARRAAEARGEILPKPKPYVPKTASPLVVGPDGQVKRRRGRPTKAEVEMRRAHEREWKRKQLAQEGEGEKEGKAGAGKEEKAEEKESEQQEEEEEDDDEEEEEEEE